MMVLPRFLTNFRNLKTRDRDSLWGNCPHLSQIPSASTSKTVKCAPPNIVPAVSKIQFIKSDQTQI